MALEGDLQGSNDNGTQSEGFISDSNEDNFSENESEVRSDKESR